MQSRGKNSRFFRANVSPSRFSPSVARYSAGKSEIVPLAEGAGTIQVFGNGSGASGRGTKALNIRRKKILRC